MNGFTDFGRKQCPLCGAVGKDLKEVEDRKPNKRLYKLSTGMFMYPKINVCKKCGYRF